MFIVIVIFTIVIDVEKNENIYRDQQTISHDPDRYHNDQNVWPSINNEQTWIEQAVFGIPSETIDYNAHSGDAEERMSSRSIRYSKFISSNGIEGKRSKG